MDTKFWGPSGWILLHSIAYKYPLKPTIIIQNKYKRFYLILPKILPCKYCRNSLKEFYKELPIDNFLASRNKLTKWIYLIHNKVNDKLRKQKLITSLNPTKQEIDKKYKNILAKKINNKLCLGWKFLYSIAFNYLEDSNKTKKQLDIVYIKFYKYLGDVIACDIVKTRYNKYMKMSDISNNLENKKMLTKWLYSLECYIDNDFSASINNEKYKDICKSYKKVMVKSCKKTCRINSKYKTKRI